jgi:phosphoserine aminotransferase
MTERVTNFSAGPAALPLPVLEHAQRELLSLPGVGASVLEISHRSKTFIEIMDRAEADLRELLGISDDYQVLFLQGGSRLQFSMVPMNLLGEGQSADYLVTGSWGKKALDEAVKEGNTRVAWDGKSTNYDRLPSADQLDLDPSAAYAYFTSNETIQGVQFLDEPAVGDVPLVCDASSDFMCRPLPIEKYGLIYACAQKNAGPAGVTVVILRKDLLERSRDSLPGYLNYREHAEQNSMYNTPPTFGIYMVGLVAKWLREEIGGLTAMEAQNRAKSAMLYEAIDRSDGFYRGHAAVDSRSLMNVTFRLPGDQLDGKFVTDAGSVGLTSLKGYRSVGGIRASIYNAMPVAGVERLRDFMLEFCQANR